MVPTPQRNNSPTYQVFRWIMLGVFVLGFAVLCFWVLAPWQLHKNSRTEKSNAIIQQAASLPAVSYIDLHHGIPDADHAYRLVTIAGHFVPTPPTAVRLRMVHDQPAIKILTAFHTNDGRDLLIYRGYLLGDNPQVTAVPAGNILLTARMHTDEALVPHKNHVLTSTDGLQVYSINSTILSAPWKIALQAGFFALDSTSPGVLTADPLPQLATGPYLSYGIQWIAFGILAPLGLGYVLYTEHKNRHLHQVAHAASTISTTASTPDRALVASPATATSRLSKKTQRHQLLSQLRDTETPAWSDTTTATPPSDAQKELPEGKPSAAQLSRTYDHLQSRYGKWE